MKQQIVAVLVGALRPFVLDCTEMQQRTSGLFLVILSRLCHLCMPVLLGAAHSYQMVSLVSLSRNHSRLTKICLGRPRSGVNK